MESTEATSLVHVCVCVVGVRGNMGSKVWERKVCDE